MFLLNIFGRNNAQNDEQKYDKITFKINLNENVPQFYDWNQQYLEQEEELTPSHPLYYEIFPKNQEKYVEYVTNQNDTVLGIAIKLDISEMAIKEINNISGNIYPGMKIKLPEGTDLAKLDEAPLEQLAKIKISQLLKPTQKSQEFINLKYSVFYYAGLSGYIKGNLTINSNYLIFNPALDDPLNIQKFTVQRLLKFNAIVETIDIQDASFMQIPEMSDSDVPKKLSVVQFLLYRVGNAKIEKKYKQRLKQLKLDHKAIASMSFSVGSNEQKSGSEIANELVSKVKEMLKVIEQKGQLAEAEQKNRLTNIPFYDIIHQNIQPKVQQSEIKPQMNKVIKASAILGSLAQPSDILTKQQFDNLVLSMPVIYQLYNWSKVYGSTRDGTSFNTLLNKAKGIEPAILLIKEYKGYKFGAFLIQNIETGKTGRGEMFIFTYKDKQQPQIYQWTCKNQTFVYCQKDMGIGIGMGFKYGIFLKNDLDKGSSSSTHTFGNTEILSKKQDFLVDEVQIWGIDSSY